MKKLLCLSLALSLLITPLTGCNKVSDTSSKKDENTIIVGASPTPHGEILKFAKEKLKNQGINLEIKEFTDYVIPNKALADKELDANYFQHLPFLEDFNEKNNTNLVSAGKIHAEPLSAYSNKIKSLEELKDDAIIAIPNDNSNGARALKLLEKQGLIKLKDNTLSNITEKDIVQNPKNIKIKAVEAAQLPRLLDETDISIINGNYALSAKLDTKSVLFLEDVTDIEKHVNIIAAREDNKDSENIKALVAVLKSEDLKKFIEDTYGKAVVPYK